MAQSQIHREVLDANRIGSLSFADACA